MLGRIFVSAKPFNYPISASVLVTFLQSYRPLWIIFNTSLSLGWFPQIWKTSLVTAILKSGDPSDADDVINYRPISKLHVLPKLFESLVVDALKSSVLNLVYPEQHGFTPTLSTTTNLTIHIYSFGSGSPG